MDAPHLSLPAFCLYLYISSHTSSPSLLTHKGYLTLEYVGGSSAFLEKSDLTKATLQQPLSFSWIESSNG